jgi:hypothetical protein
MRDKLHPSSRTPLPAAQGETVPAMAHAYAIAAELANPVARGYLTITTAHAEMLLSTARAERLGELGPYTAIDVFRLQKHILGLHLDQLMAKRAIAEGRLKHRIRPLIKLRQPRNRVLAEAHDVNGAEGFPFDEPDVNFLALREIHFAGRPRHG